MNEADLTAVAKAVARSYGSLSEPDYSFVTAAVVARPYSDLERRLAATFALEETTDPNDDVSFRYVLTSGGESWALDLSMVGPFALLRRLSQPSGDGVVTSLGPEAAEPEATMLALLENAGLHLLTREAAERRIALRRPNDEGEQTRVYHAVISDEPLLPWE